MDEADLLGLIRSEAARVPPQNGDAGAVSYPARGAIFAELETRGVHVPGAVADAATTEQAITAAALRQGTPRPE